MTREEFAVLVKAMKAVYSSENFIADKDAFNVWYGLLQDLPYEQANLAIQKYMTSERFPPTIADIRTKATEIIAPAEESMSELQAWALVQRALRNSGYNSEEEFAKLPEACQRAVGTAANLKEWALMDSDQVATIEQSHFIRNYRTSVQRMKEEARLPENVRMLIADMGKKHAALMQSLPLNAKISMTQRRIREWVDEYGEDGVYISFSGGKDSTVLLDIARKLYPNIKAMFIDTGLEYPEIRELKNKAIDKGVEALLRNGIVQTYNKWSERGYCPIYARENATRMYEPYHILGGNDVATDLIEDLKGLPTEPQKKKEGVEDDT